MLLHNRVHHHTRTIIRSAASTNDFRYIGKSIKVMSALECIHRRISLKAPFYHASLKSNERIQQTN